MTTTGRDRDTHVGVMIRDMYAYATGGRSVLDELRRMEAGRETAEVIARGFGGEFSCDFMNYFFVVDNLAQ